MDSSTETPSPPLTPQAEMLELVRSMHHHLERLDRRDRLRTWGGFFRGLLAIIPIAILIFSTWYAYAHLDELLKKVATQAAQSAGEYSKNSSAEFIKSMQEMIKR